MKWTRRSRWIALAAATAAALGAVPLVVSAAAEHVASEDIVELAPETLGLPGRTTLVRIDPATGRIVDIEENVLRSPLP